MPANWVERLICRLFPAPGRRRIEKRRPKQLRRKTAPLLCESLEDRVVPSSYATLPQLIANLGPYIYTPDQIRAAYGINGITYGAYPGDGLGQTIAIVDAYDISGVAMEELDAFDKATYLTPAAAAAQNASQTLYSLYGPASDFLNIYNQEGQNITYPTYGEHIPSAPVGNWAGEEALDIEWAHAIAPGTNIDLVEADSSDYTGVGGGPQTDLLEATTVAASLPGVSVVSMSWGDAEYGSIFKGYETNDDGYFNNKAGVTFLAATGDNGHPGQYPAYSPDVIAVGGTSLHLYANDTVASELPWSGSGGGVSQYESEPVYQELAQSSGFRETPDVAFDADPNTGVAVYDSVTNSISTPWQGIGGTSLATPCWAGLIAIANEGRKLDGLPVLNSDDPQEALDLLYSLPAADFNGIGVSPGGYDDLTGLGSPVANLLVPDLATKLVVSSTTDNSDAPVPLSLRDDIDMVNADHNADPNYFPNGFAVTIIFAPWVTTINSFDTGIPIQSQGGVLTIDGGNTVTIGTYYGIWAFSISAESDVILEDLWIQNCGYSAIINDGVLHIDNCILSDNSGDDGGAIDNAGTLYVTDGVFSNNYAEFGGAIYNDGGSVTIANSSMTSNSAFLQGGAIDNENGTVQIVGTGDEEPSILDDNIAFYHNGTTEVNDGTEVEVGGGAIYNSGVLTINDVELLGNSSYYIGGAIYDVGSVTATNCVFSGNTSGNANVPANENGGGGAIYSQAFANGMQLVVSFDDCSFQSNTAINGIGGAIDDVVGIISIFDFCSFSENSAASGGAIAVVAHLDDVEIADATFTDNTVGFGNVATDGNGGAILVSDGTCNVIDSTFNGNRAQKGGAVYGDNYVGISAVTIVGCLLENNLSDQESDAVYAAGNMTIVNSTFYRNVSDDEGQMTLANCTMNDGGDGDILVGSGKTVSLVNCILAPTGNLTPNITGSGSVIGSNNLICNAAGTASGLSRSSNQLGNVGGAPVLNPELGALGNYGGPTETMPLLAGSPALGSGEALGEFFSATSTTLTLFNSPFFAAASLPVLPSGFYFVVQVDGEQMEVTGVTPGSNNTATLNVVRTSPATHTVGDAVYLASDQRGQVTLTTKPDIGAFQTSAGLIVTTNSDAISHSGTSLRDAVTAANNQAKLGIPATITFAASLANEQFIFLQQGDLELLQGDTAPITIDAKRAAWRFRDQRRGESGVFVIDSGVSAVFLDLNIEGGTDSDGGGIYNSGTLTLEQCNVEENSASNLGAGIYNNDSGVLTILNSTLSNNGSTLLAAGGGLFNYGTATLINTTLSGNTSEHGGADWDNPSATLTLANCTLSQNTATQAGGGIDENNATLTLTNCTLSQNSATQAGGGIDATDATLTLINTIVAGNSVPTGADIGTTSTTTAASNTWIGSSIGNTIATGAGSTNILASASNLLGSLNNYGGPTSTVALLPGSPGSPNPAFGNGAAVTSVFYTEGNGVVVSNGSMLAASSLPVLQSGYYFIVDIGGAPMGAHRHDAGFQ